MSWEAMLGVCIGGSKRMTLSSDGVFGSVGCGVSGVRCFANVAAESEGGHKFVRRLRNSFSLASLAELLYACGDEINACDENWCM